MALYAFDGTGQRDDNPDIEDAGDTNVARFFRAYRPNDTHLPIDDRRNHYQRGIGSAGLLRKSRGAALALDFVNEIAKGKVKLADGSIPRVRFLGLFDCVPSFGIPITPLISAGISIFRQTSSGVSTPGIR